MKKYITQYKVNGIKFGSHIWAKNMNDANIIAIQRCIGEKVLGLHGISTDGFGRKVPEVILNPDFRGFNYYQFLHELPAIIHSASFLCWIAGKMGIENIDSILGDDGIMHELIHLHNHPTETKHIKLVRIRFEKLQDSIPGMFNIK